jgi:hypothetical protein
MSQNLATGRQEIGVLAQEVEAVFPELVTSWGDKSYKAVAYGKFTAVLIEAVRELRAEKEAQIAALEARLTTKEAQVAALEARLTVLEQAIGRYNAAGPVSSSVLPGRWALAGGLFLAGLVFVRRWHLGRLPQSSCRDTSQRT